MKKSIFLFFAAILCAIGAKAFDQPAVDLYFDNSTSRWENCYVYIGHDSHTSCYSMTRVSGTQYLWNLPANFNGGNSWGNASGWVICCEKWWESSEENVYKFVYHGSEKVTDITTGAWDAGNIYKADGTTSVRHFDTDCTVYKVTSSTKSNYKVTINTVEGGTLTVKDYDDQAVASGDSKIHLTVLKFSATPASGYVLDAVEINDGTNTTIIAAADLATTTHTLTSAITINPVWRATTSTVTVTATATNGTVTGGGIVEEGTSVTLTATPADGYKFVNWTVGGAEVSTANPYTFTAEEDVTVVANFEELPKVTVYAINSIGWTAVAVHHWHEGGAGTAWPGDLMTTIAEKDPNGFDIYTATFLKEHENCIFNNNDQGSQTGTLAVKDGQYYDLKSNTWYASLAEVPAPDPLATEVYLVGEMTNWGDGKIEFKKSTIDATTARVTVTLEAQTYKFKLVVDGAWKGNTGTMQRGGDAVHEGGWSFDKNGYDDNCQIVADIAGDYTFTWDLNTKKLTVAYPPLPKHQVNATVNPAESGTVTGTGEYEQGSQATLVATPAAGYTFKNWSVGDTKKSAEATYKFTVTEAIELVANFVPEATNEVTVAYLCNGTPIPGQAETKLAVGVTTPSTISAPAITNYKFDSWTLGTGVQSEDDSKNPIQITTKAEGEYTLKANYTKIGLTYNVQVPAGTKACYIAGDMNSWAFQEMEAVTGETNKFTITIVGANETDEYKYACQASWEYQEQKEDGGYVDNRTWTELDKVEKWGKPVIVTYQLKGVGGWEQPGIELVQNPGNDKEYMLTCQAISATDAIKVVRLEDGVIKDYYGNGTVKDGVEVTVSYDGEANIKLPEGNYNFYFDTNASEKKLWIEAATDCEPTPDYTRTVTPGNYGTICLPFGATSYTGMELYEFVGRETGKAYIASVTTLKAGYPYIFRATANELAVYSDGTTADEAGSYNGLHGTFADDTEVAVNNYILYNNAICKVTATCWVDANRAYIVWEEIPNGAPQQMPGRKYIGMDVTGENEATGFENITHGENTTIKVIENGQLIIIRNGEKFNAQGQKL